MIDSIDYDKLFEKLKAAVLESPFGGMINMFGGAESLDNLREPMIAKTKEAIHEMSQEDSFQEQIGNAISKGLHLDQLIHKVEHIVSSRLDELTPQMVKEIIQDMIREHLGWLVVLGWFLWWTYGLDSQSGNLGYILITIDRDADTINHGLNTKTLIKKKNLMSLHFKFTNASLEQGFNLK